MVDGDENGGKNDYEVGYGRPPKHTQFPKGVSGNPKGRRKGSRGLKTDLEEALRATLTITVGGKKVKGTTQRLAMYGLAVKSATGDLRAQKLLTDLILLLFGPGDRDGNQARLSRQDEELLERLLDRLSSGDETPAQGANGAGQTMSSDEQSREGGVSG